MDLFSGAGGFSLGFRTAGFLLHAAVDVDETAVATLARNFAVLQEPGDTPLLFSGDDGNLEEIDLRRIVSQNTQIDVLVGGPPCQGFSRIGRAKLDSLSDEGFEGDPRNGLYIRFLDAAELWKPRAVVMENVPGMLSVGGRNVADDAAADLAARGYRVGYAMLNAAWYGVPQFRERLFIIGLRDDLGKDPEMPPASHHAILPSGYARPNEHAWNLALPFIRHRELPVATEECGALRNDRTRSARWLACPSAPPRESPTTISSKGGASSAYSRLMQNWPGLASRTRHRTRDQTHATGLRYFPENATGRSLSGGACHCSWCCRETYPTRRSGADARSAA